MERQLVLIDTPGKGKTQVDDGPRPDWHIDSRTREVGRKGIAAAREALRRPIPSHAA